jgi:hypothetical protein
MFKMMNGGAISRNPDKDEITKEIYGNQASK